MHNVFRCLLLSFLILLICSGEVSADNFNATIVDVKSGDTLTAKINQKEYEVYLYGISAPHMSQPHGKEAKEFLSRFLNQKVELASRNKVGKKISAVVYGLLKSRMGNINSHMVLQGLAWADTRQKQNPYISEQNLAKKNKLGLWAEPNPIKPWKYNDYLKKVQAEKQTALAEEDAARAKVLEKERIRRNRARADEDAAKAKAAREERIKKQKEQKEQEKYRVEHSENCFEVIKFFDIHNVKLGMTIGEAEKILGQNPQCEYLGDGRGGYGKPKICHFKLNHCTALHVTDTEQIIWSMSYVRDCETDFQGAYNALVSKFGNPLEYEKKGSGNVWMSWCRNIKLHYKDTCTASLSSDGLVISISARTIHENIIIALDQSKKLQPEKNVPTF